MAENKYDYKGEKELLKKLNSLGEKEKLEFLTKYTEGLAKTFVVPRDSQEASEITKEVTESVLNVNSPSQATVNSLEQAVRDIEGGTSSLDRSTIDSAKILSKSLGIVASQPMTTAKRYHSMRFGAKNTWDINTCDATSCLITTSAGFGYRFSITPENGYDPSGHDTVVNLEDVSAGAPFPNTYGPFGNSVEMYINFTPSDYQANYPVTKDIRVTWASGYQKVFTMSALNNKVNTPPITWGGNGDNGAHVRGCFVGKPDKYQYSVLNCFSRWRATMTGEVLLYTISNPLQNPYGHLETRDYLAMQANGANGGVHSNNSHLTFGMKSNGNGWGGGSGNEQHMIPHVQSPDEQTIRFTHRQMFGADGNSSNRLKNVGQIGNIYNKADALTAFPAMASSGKGWKTTGGDDPDYYQSPANTPQIWSSESAVIADQITQGKVGNFWQTIIYADNLSPCPVVQAPAYDVCLTSGTPNYYLTTCLDCNGAVIPTNDCNGTNGATFNDGGCCVDCSWMTAQVIGADATFGNQDGEIFWDAANPAASLTLAGTPWSSGSAYTVTLTTSNGVVIANQPPAGGTTFNVNVTTVNGVQEVTIPSNAQVSTGMLVSGAGIPLASYIGPITAGAQHVNVTKFLLVNVTGASVVATAGATVAGTFSTQIRSSFANLLPNIVGGLGSGTYYTLCVTDNLGCVECSNITLGQSAAPTGCTDSTALNYDPSAITDDGSCILCDAGTGQITDISGGMNGPLFPSSVDSVLDATVNGSNVPQSDGQFSLTAFMQNTAAFYLEVDGTQSYTFTLYDLTVAADPTSIISTVATQAGLAVTTFGPNPNHTFTGLAYGHYAIKVELVDSDEVHGLEACYEYFYGTVKVPVCDDVTATNYNSSSVPADFQISDPSLCTFASACCGLDSIAEATNKHGGTPCNPALYSAIGCDPGAISVSGQWLLNGTAIPNSAFALGAVAGTGPTLILQDSFGTNLYTVSGTYTLEITSTYSSAPDCTTSVVGAFVYPICGCTDPTALNYDALATIDDGSCIYPSWDCINGLCSDPGTGTGQYNSSNGGLSGCQAACTPIVPGCTDPCANNFNPVATIDDGSCLYKACLDPAASNQYWSCDCNVSKPSATIADPGCCTYPCAVGPTVSIWSQVDSTGTCTVPLPDGDIRFEVTLNNGAIGFYFEIFDSIGTTSVCATTNFYNAPFVTPLVTTMCGIGLAAGNYQYLITDNLGCVTMASFTINTTSPSQGCTDPAADNYDPAAACDDGTCVYCGCMDPLATNYNPNAVCDDGSCIYVIPDNPCIPPSIDRRILEITACLSEKGTTWLNKYKIGTADDCTIMNKWKLIFIQYLLTQKGLTCLYNCADEESMDLASLTNCSTAAATGGPRTGLNDQAFAGSSYSLALGTTVDNPALFFVPGNTLFFGDVITFTDSAGNSIVYQMVSPGSCINGCEDPQTATGITSGNWVQCVPSNNVTITNTTNYIDIFINFANKYCRDCKITIETYGRKGKSDSPKRSGLY